MPKIAISCVIDDQPKFFMQGWNWLSSLQLAGAPERAEIHIHHLDTIDPERLAPFLRLGARLTPIAPFGQGAAVYCNKLRQLDTPALAEADYVILTDADIAFLKCPTRLAEGEEIAAKQVDLTNPPEEIWRRLMDAAGVDPGAPRELELNPGAYTFPTNFNGGLYVIPKAHFAALTTLWPKWAAFCLAQEEILGKYLHHADQLGFGLAVLEAQARIRQLPVHENLPLHLPERLAHVVPAPIGAIHYHSALDTHGLLRPTGIAWIDENVARFNRALTAFRRDIFDNRVFWDFRYAHAPELGSGLGSRGDVKDHKRAMLTPYMRAFADQSVLDAGCGDLEVMHAMENRVYRGIDPSPTAIAIASKKRPDWVIDTTPITAIADVSHDLVLCLDVLIHQPTAQDFQALLDHCLRVSRKALIVSGYKNAGGDQGIVFSNLGLEQALRAHPDVSAVTEIGAYRDLHVFLAEKKGAALANAHDISLPDLAYGCAEASDWRLLLELVAESREKLGFFPGTIIRTIEYPWFAYRLRNYVRRRVLDIGAGVCVLPLWLARKGCQVVTVDNHSRVRRPPAERNWNEWGFIDYAAIDPAIESHQVSVTEYQPAEPFDAIYSVSVLEHMPAAVRRATIVNIERWLAPGGRAFLSFDLVPGSDAMWPLSEGKAVDPEGTHGTLADVLEEIRGTGMHIVETSVRRNIRASRTDLAFVEAVAEEG